MRAVFCLVLLGLVFQTYCQNDNNMFNSLIDLNSDKIKDNIKLEILDSDSADYKLIVNDQIVIGKLYDRTVKTDGFQVIDIDNNDKYKEIAIHSPGPSNDDEYIIYWYDGAKLIFMSHFTSFITVKGNGFIYSKDWECFWVSLEKYSLDDKTRKLILIPQFAYYVGVEVSVTNNFTIFREKELLNPVALVAADTKIDILLCDNKDIEWLDRLFLIKTESGLIGWAKFADFRNNTSGYNMAD